MQRIDIFPWLEAFDSGIPSLDAQHYHLLQMVNRLAAPLAESSDVRDVQQCLADLENRASHYFGTGGPSAAQQLGNAPWPGPGRGTRESLASGLNSLRASLETTDITRVVDHTIEFLARWLVARIVGGGGSPPRAGSAGAEAATGTVTTAVDKVTVGYVTACRHAFQLQCLRATSCDIGRALQEEQAFYKDFILQLTLAFIHLPLQRMDAAIEDALAQVSGLLSADRAGAFFYGGADEGVSTAYEWCAPGVQPRAESLREVALPTGFDWRNAHRRGRPFVVRNRTPGGSGAEEDRTSADSQRALLTVPMMDGARWRGFLALEFEPQQEPSLEEAEAMLGLFASLLESLRQRREMADVLSEKNAALEVANERLVHILDGADAAVYVVDMQTYEVLFVNSSARRLLGDAVGGICWEVFQGYKEGPCSFCTNAQLLEADGTPAAPVIWEHFNARLQRWFQVHDQAIPWDDGRYVRMEVALDITEQRRAEQSLRDSEERYRVLFEQSHDAMMIVTPPEWRFREGNPAMAELFGARDLDELLGLTPVDLSPPAQPDGTPSGERAEELLATAMHEGSWFGEWVHRRLDGQDIICTVLLTRAEFGGEVVIQATVRDITAQKAQQHQLEHIAHYDSLTGLPNRVLLADRLHQAMSQAQRRDTVLAIAYLDLDGFKSVNDRCGHDSGDRFLARTAARMRHALREADTLARLGGDEFVAVLGDLPDADASLPLLSRLLKAAAGQAAAGEATVGVSASIGVTFYPQDEAIDAEQLLRQADQAMYQAKLAGKNRFHFFDVVRERAVRGRLEDLARIERALADGEFVLYYQPRVNLRTGETVGLEALVRWRHPDGLLLPEDFLPSVEGHALEIVLGNWVLDTALAEMSQWRQMGVDVRVSVNVSAGQLQHPQFVPSLEKTLARYDALPPQRLELEMRESSALQDPEGITRIIEACHDLGVGFALDDFGSGYSSLTFLRRLPTQTLKIDREFLRDMLQHPQNLAVLENLVGLARAFQRTPVAVGVEIKDYGERLLESNCELAQGFAIAQPMPAAAVPEWMSAAPGSTKSGRP